VSGFGIRLARYGLLGALGEPDQLLRLARFRAAHPEVIIGDGGFGTVQARIPEWHLTVPIKQVGCPRDYWQDPEANGAEREPCHQDGGA